MRLNQQNKEIKNLTQLLSQNTMNDNFSPAPSSDDELPEIAEEPLTLHTVKLP